MLPSSSLRPSTDWRYLLFAVLILDWTRCFTSLKCRLSLWCPFLLFLEEIILLTDQTLNMLGNPWETSFWTNFLYRDNWEIPLSMTVLRESQISSTSLMSGFFRILSQLDLMYDLKPSQFVFIEWNRSWDLLTFVRFYISIYQHQVMISNTRVYFCIIYKSRVWCKEIIQDIFASCGLT